MQQNLQIPNTETVKRKFDYGMKENDPMCFHHFYNKLEDDKPCTLTKCNVSFLVVISSKHNLYSLINWGYFVPINLVQLLHLSTLMFMSMRVVKKVLLLK